MLSQATDHETDMRGVGWGLPELIETDDADDADNPQVAIDANGNALAVWYQDDGMRTNIWSNRYTAGSGWGMAELIETGRPPLRAQRMFEKLAPCRP